jgi:hypothetical protein
VPAFGGHASGRIIFRTLRVWNMIAPQELIDRNRAKAEGGSSEVGIELGCGLFLRDESSMNSVNHGNNLQTPPSNRG